MLTALRELADKFEEIAIPAHGRYVDYPALMEDGTAYCATEPPPIDATAPLHEGSGIGDWRSETPTARARP